MLKRRIALVSAVTIVASIGVAPAAWAFNSGPPKPEFSGNERAAIVCHSYPGATVLNRNGVHGTPDGECLLG